MKYWKSSQDTHKLMYHLVWIPKYRKRISKGKLSERLKELLIECTDMNRLKIEEVDIQLDHVHLLVQILPKLIVSLKFSK